MQQGRYALLNARASLSQIDGPFELAVIGNNLTNKIVCGQSAGANLQNGASFGGVRTGATTRGPAGIDEISCRLDRGREITFRLSVRL